MAYQANLPAPMSFSGDIPSNWKKFHKSFQIYIGATGRDVDTATMNEAAKKAHDLNLGKLLLNIAGEEAISIANTFDLSEEEEFSYAKLVDKFKAYAAPEKNETYLRFLFNRTKQQEGETFDHFLTEARTRIKECGFGGGALEDSILRDRIVEGISDKRLQQALIKNAKLDLKTAIEECRATEASRKYMEDLQEKPSPVSVDSLGKQKVQLKPKGKNYNPLCQRCGYGRNHEKCPANGKTCAKCFRQNHFAQVCKSKTVLQTDDLTEVEKKPEDHGYEYVFTDSVGVNDQESPVEYRQPILVAGKIIDFKLDPGTRKSILPLKNFEALNCGKELKPSKYLLQPYGEKSPPISVCEVTLETKIGGQTKTVQYLVSPDRDKPLFGLADCERFGLIQRVILPVHDTTMATSKEAFIRENLDIFSGVGSFPGEHPILTKPEAKQVVSPVIRRPKTVNDKLKPALDKMEAGGIIKKVEHLTEESWVSNIVVVTKPNGSIRICLDPVDLNKAIIREPHLIPTIAELSERLNHQQYYTLLDLKDGFYHIKLDEPSSFKCCFATPFGLYRFLRCPFGVSSAPELFQKLNEKVFGGLDNVNIYFDDVLVVGRTQLEHDQALLEVVKRARAANVRFNPEKLQYKQSSVKYVGHVFSKEGMAVDPERIKTILQLDPPKSRKELQSVLGTLNYVREYIPQMSKLTDNMRRLLKKDVEWIWGEPHTADFNKLKQLLSSAPVLANFDPSKKIIIQSDASQSGLGCCLIQDNHPVAFASRSLSTSETNYSVSEKELLGIVFATSKFHNYIYGYQVEVQTDHLPLIPMLGKEIHKLGSRTLQRLRLKLLKYNINLIHVPGKLMYMSDLFSRTAKELKPDDDSHLETVHSVSMVLPMNEKLKNDLQKATSEDRNYVQIVHYIKNGWPSQIGQLSDALMPFFKVRNELFYEDGIIYLNEDGKIRIVVPPALRVPVLNLIHSHMGIDKAISRAKEAFYWPQMLSHVELFVKKCQTCNKFKPKPYKMPLQPHELPTRRWQRISMDIATYGGRDYLVTYDAYSKWLEINLLSSKSAEAVVDICKTLFASHGRPQTIISDNNPFGSFLFRKFAKECNIQIITSSPHYPQSNGRAEKGVAIAKIILKKAKETNTDHRDLLLEYRNTKIPSMGYSPAQLMYSCKLKASIPISEADLQPEVPKNVTEKLEKQQEKTRAWYDKTARRKEISLRVGDKVRIQSPNRWKSEWSPGEITEVCPEPRSYLVKTNGSVVRRTLAQLELDNEDHREIEDYEILLSSQREKKSEPIIPQIPEERQPETSQTQEESEPDARSPENDEGSEYDTTYQLVVPHWLYNTNYVTRFGRFVKPV